MLLCVTQTGECFPHWSTNNRLRLDDCPTKHRAHDKVVLLQASVRASNNGKAAIFPNSRQILRITHTMYGAVRRERQSARESSGQAHSLTQSR